MGNSSSHIKSCCQLLSIWKWFYLCVVYFCIWLLTRLPTRPSPPLQYVFIVQFAPSTRHSSPPFFLLPQFLSTRYSKRLNAVKADTAQTVSASIRLRNAMGNRSAYKMHVIDFIHCNIFLMSLVLVFFCYPVIQFELNCNVT